MFIIYIIQKLLISRMALRQINRKMHLNQNILLLCLLISLIKAYNLTFEQFLNSKPSTFGLLTVTHARNGKYQYFQNHLHRYAQMQCPSMTQISVAWNNDVTPQGVGFLQDPTWKRPVYFIKTPYNAMDFRYLLPQQSTAKVFFNIDDDITITCQQLMKSFKIWTEKAVGDIAPILSYGPRGYDYNSLMNQYLYNDPLARKYHSMSLVGVGWLPRVFLQLYYTQKSWQLAQMRKIVKQKNNCDDIALNFMVNYYFPELVPIFLTGEISYAIHPRSQGLTSTHYKFRSECLKQFSQIIGYNSLRTVNKYDTGNPNRFVSQAQKYVLYLRRKQIAQKFIQKGFVNKQISRDTIQNWVSNFKIQNNYKVFNNIQNLNQQQKFDKKNYQEQGIKRELQKIKAQYTSEVQLIRQKSEQFRKLVESGKSKNHEKISQNSIKTHNVQQLTSTLTKVAIIGAFLSIFILFMFVYLVSDCKDACKEDNLQNQPDVEQD